MTNVVETKSSGYILLSRLKLVLEILDIVDCLKDDIKLTESLGGAVLWEEVPESLQLHRAHPLPILLQGTQLHCLVHHRHC